MTDRPSAVELLAQGEGLLTRSHLAELGLGRSAVDAVFREIAKTGGVVVYPGSTRPRPPEPSGSTVAELGEERA